MLGILLFFLVSGVGMLFGLSPFMTWPHVCPDVCSLSLFFFLSLSLSLSLVRYFRRRRFLSFSLSQVLGKPKPPLGFGIPLVSLHPGHDRPPGSVLRAPHLHLGQVPAPGFFCSPSPSFACMVVVGLCLSGPCLVGGCFFLVLVLAAFLALRAFMMHRRGGWRECDDHHTPHYHHYGFLGRLGEDQRPAWPTRADPPHPLPAERCKGQPRKGVGEDSARQPYCHTVLGVCVGFFPLLEVGNAVRFFTFCFLSLVRRPLPFFLQFFSSSGCCSEKFSGASFCFWVSVLVLCFLSCFA